MGKGGGRLSVIVGFVSGKYRRVVGEPSSCRAKSRPCAAYDFRFTRWGVGWLGVTPACTTCRGSSGLCRLNIGRFGIVGLASVSVIIGLLSGSRRVVARVRPRTWKNFCTYDEGWDGWHENPHARLVLLQALLLIIRIVARLDTIVEVDLALLPKGKRFFRQKMQFKISFQKKPCENDRWAGSTVPLRNTRTKNASRTCPHLLRLLFHRHWITNLNLGNFVRQPTIRNKSKSREQPTGWARFGFQHVVQFVLDVSTTVRNTETSFGAHYVPFTFSLSLFFQLISFVFICISFWR